MSGGETNTERQRHLSAAEKATVKSVLDEAIRIDFPIDPPLDRDGNPKFSATDEQLCKEPQNDLGNSKRLLSRYGDTIRYVEKIGWHGWTGTHWCHEEGERIAEKSAHLTAHDMKREILALIHFGQYAAESDDDFRERIGKFRKWVNNSGNGTRLSAMLQLAKSYLAVSHEALDQNRFLVNVENGTIDLIAPGGPTLRKHDPRDLISKKMNVSFDPKADCPVFKRSLQEMQPDPYVREFLQRFFGYCLTGDVTEQVIVMFYGATASNGKSTLMNLFSWLLGSYAIGIPIASLMAQDRTQSGSNATPDIARLPARRFVTAAEPEAGEKFSERVIKIISGEDKITARHLNQGFFEFALQCKFVISFNEQPGVRGGDEGFWRRVLLVPFAQQFKPLASLDQYPGALEIDPELPQKLRGEAAGILNWMIEGYLMWREGGLNVPTSIRQAVDDYKMEANNVLRFVEDWCHRGPSLSTPVNDLYAGYNLWAKQNAQPPVTSKTFGSRLAKIKGITRKRANPSTCYLGLSLKDFVMDDLRKKISYRSPDDHPADTETPPDEDHEITV